jgi:hypothetical protein
MFFLATADSEGRPQCSYKGGAPGFVRVRVAVDEVFPNCPRYLHRMELTEPSVFVPAPDGTAPVPDWKREPWACDVLAADDPAHA